MFRQISSFYLRIRNAVDYPLRQFFRWRRSGLRLPTGTSAGLFSDLPTGQRARAINLADRLHAEYHLEPLLVNTAAGIYRENLFYLDLLESALERADASLGNPFVAADIGPSHWFYVRALYSLLRWWRCPQGRDLSLTGYEVDAYRVYADFHSRYDHAQAHIRDLPGVTFLPRPFQRQESSLDLVLMLFPFVFERDHLLWGLPAGLFQPERLLEDGWLSLKPGGVLVVVNQGRDEHKVQAARLSALGIVPRAAYRQDPLLFRYAFDRYVLVSIREP
ncbi:MAG TPA: hypothetical protein VMT46_00425 [Anaerolineaceae bacterium]|nr:hypothetical protein [Anaerolineaceae bacterium]